MGTVKLGYRFLKGNKINLGRIPWNKGIRGICFNTGRTHFKRGQALRKGIKPTLDMIEKIREHHKGKHFSKNTEFKKGRNHIFWKHGLSKTKEYLLGNARKWKQKNKKRLIEYSKNYMLAHPGLKSICDKKYREKHKEDIRNINRIYRHSKKYKMLRNLRKNAGDLTKKTIQIVYEDNIKKYGTLTCYLCEKPIIFGDDTLEHKIPICRNGTNDYYNLDIAHRSCNSRKNKLTEEEYRRRYFLCEELI